MVFNTLTVGAAVTPSVVETYFSHYLKRGPLRHKPTAHISYHEGLRLIREFLDYSSKHTIEDLQSFTGQWVPAPIWVRINDAEVAPKFLDRAARLLQAQLGHRSLEMLGGRTWWQWRRPDTPLRAEWIEMKKEAQHRNLTGAKCERVMLYIHGGAYYFGSVDEHRYQMQRHARKLRARVLSPRYRLAPQYPFPCGLYDCLATYFYLLEHFQPAQILFAGDSAGAGMVLSMLVTLRDQEQPLPAGTILLSPWVDLTHSFPSVAGDGKGDYIPPHGFHHRPSMAWPPPPCTDKPGKTVRVSIPDGAVELPAVVDADTSLSPERKDAAQDEEGRPKASPTRPPPRFGQLLTIELDGREVELRDQIQMYTTNQLLSHPLVSPVLQPSLGGLPPMLIQVGGAELLKDEQLYLAHKAANPAAYPPNETIMHEFDPQRKSLEKWPPTYVQLQLWEDLCHVPHTLSFTRPAKYMYRSVAQFAAWALAHAQKHSISIINDDAISIISSAGEEEDDDDQASVAESSSGTLKSKFKRKVKSSPSVGKAGDPLPLFKDHMIRQQVTRHGIIYPLPPESEIPALALDPESIGVPKSGPVRKWLAAHQASEVKFANEWKKVERKRAKELAQGYDKIPGERPPPTALVNRRRKGSAPEEKKKGRNWGLAMWSGWGSSHDERTLQREEKTEREAMRLASASSTSDLRARPRLLSVQDVAEKRRSRSNSTGPPAARMHQRLASSRDGERAQSPLAPSLTAPHEQEVVDSGQASETAGDTDVQRSDTTATTSRPVSRSTSSPIPVEHETAQDEQAADVVEDAPIAVVPTTSLTSPSSERIPGTDHTYMSPASNRPHNGLQAYPFKLKDSTERTVSTMTLDSQHPDAHVSEDTTPSPSEAPDDDDSEIMELPGFAEIEAMMAAAIESVGNAREDKSPSPMTAAETAATPSRDMNSSTLDKLEGNPEPVVPDETPAKIERAVSPVGLLPTQPKTPFKLRNPVFDNRTSMLGSIGADGMPNAHYAFGREDSPQRVSPLDISSSQDAMKSDENTKGAPFKIRHTVYEPDVTLGAAKVVGHSNVPEHASTFEAGDKKGPDASSHREIAVVGGQVNDQRDGGPSPLYSSPAHTLTSSSPSRLPTVPSDDESDERPPPPPPKDASYVPSTRNKTGLRRMHVNGSSASLNTDGLSGPKVGTPPPVIGELASD